MYKICVTPQSRKRQRELEKGFMDALLSRGYENIGISRLCDELGVPRKSFYRYFNGKEGALYALIDHKLDDFAGELLMESGELLGAMELFFEYWKKNSRFLDAIVKNELTGLFMLRALKYSVEKNAAAESIPFSHFGMKKEHVMSFFVSGLLMLLFQWYREGFPESPREMAQTAVHLVTRPVMSVMMPK